MSQQKRMGHQNYLRIAREQASLGEAKGDFLAGAILVKQDGKQDTNQDEVLSMSHDRRQQDNNPIASAEMECIRLAGRRTDQATLTLISTRYPDRLIAGTILQFSIGALVIGQPEISTPAIEMLKSKNVPIYFYPNYE